MKEFDESKHPRDDDGKFTDGNNSGKTQWITSKRDYSNVQGGEGKSLQNDNGSDIIHSKDEVDTPTFVNALKDAKASIAAENAWRVSSPDTAEFDSEHPNAKKYRTKGGSTIAISPDGDIVSVCRKIGDNVRGSDLLKFAVANGGTKLDSFSGLWKFYSKNGFEPVSWTPFDKNYAPDGWKEEYDEEPVIFWKYTGGKTKYLNHKDFIKSVPPDDSYEEAKIKRDKEIKNGIEL
ncbi:MAG: hypothetical protein ACI4MZ_01250 [Christensenellales bacterium]